MKISTASIVAKIIYELIVVSKVRWPKLEMRPFTSATIHAPDRFAADSCGWRLTLFKPGSYAQLPLALHSSTLCHVGMKARVKTGGPCSP